ncbi:MAG: oligopeptide/dipeptide ABC transporter ATP-binding protein [Acetobacteraceae bacterium]|nr:ATP-binding cassette domain-containing protein [Pseudomonadota bacterium]
MSKPCLQVRDLNVKYPVGSTFLGAQRWLHAASDVSLHIDAGETLGLVGESGSGKSTTGMAILRLVTPHSGTVRLGDTDVTKLPASGLRALRRRMQIVFQDPYSSLNPSMTIAQLLEEPLQIHANMSKSDRQNAVAEILRAVGLHAGYAARYPHEFSGGQRQRIAIARAMILHPELVVLDEPVSALDVSTQSQILNLLKAIQDKSGTAFLLVAHDLAVVRLMSPRVAVMYLGEIVEEGPSGRVYDSPGHPYSMALISAIPFPDPVRQRSATRLILRGDLPSLMRPPSGCRFRTRCPFAMEICAQEKPPPAPIEGGGTAACHLHAHGPRLRGRSVQTLLTNRPGEVPQAAMAASR